MNSGIDEQEQNGVTVPSKCRDAVHDAVKTSEYFFAAFGRKIALDITDQENQKTKQDGNLDDIVQEKLQAADPAVCRIEPEGFECVLKELIQPFHCKYLILEKVPAGF